MEQSKFKVVIVGGSVSGLTLANMLEKLNIDYVVLESYKTIAPQVGASIGLQANGLRILDQLGCANTLLDLVDTPLQSHFLRDSEGKEIVKFEGFARILENRYARGSICEAEQYLFWTVEQSHRLSMLITSVKTRLPNDLYRSTNASSHALRESQEQR